MTEEEIKNEEEERSVETWTMDDLVSLTDEVQEAEIEFREKKVKFQFCELVEAEEPKFKPLLDSASDEEKMAYYTEIGGKRILAMLEKANEKKPDGPCIGKKHWALLPTTLRYNISTKIKGIEQDTKENFPF